MAERVLTLEKFAQLVRCGFAVHFTPGHEPRPWRAEFTSRGDGTCAGHVSALGATPEEAVTELARGRALALKQKAAEAASEAKRAVDESSFLNAALGEVAGG